MQPGIEALLARVTRLPEGSGDDPFAKVLQREAGLDEGRHQLAVLEQEVENKTKEVRLDESEYFTGAVLTIVDGLTVPSRLPADIVTSDTQALLEDAKSQQIPEARTVTPGILKPNLRDWLATKLVDDLASSYHEFSSPFFLAYGLCQDAYQGGPQACIAKLKNIIGLLELDRQASRYSDYPDYVKGLADVRQILVGVVQRLN